MGVEAEALMVQVRRARLQPSDHLGQGLTTVGVGGKTRATLTRSEPFFGQMISVRPSGRGWLSSSPEMQHAWFK